MDLKKYYDESVFEHDSVLYSGAVDYPKLLSFGTIAFEQVQERLKMFNHAMRLEELGNILRQVADNHKRRFWRYGQEKKKTW